MITYIDASAAAKLIVNEPESEKLQRRLALQGETDRRFVASAIIETELRRMATRLDKPQHLVTALLDRIDLVAVNPSILAMAGLIPGINLRSLDAIHVATAIAVGTNRFLTFDRRQATAALSVGLPLEGAPTGSDEGARG